MDNEIFRRELANRKFELTDDGKLLLPQSQVILGGIMSVEHQRAGRVIGHDFNHNIVVSQGLDHILTTIFSGGSAVNPWYLALFEGNYTPVTGDTAATFPGSATECIAYDEASRQEFIESAPSGNAINNSASKAQFTMNDTKTVYGGFLVSVSTKSATTGTLMSASKFAASRNVVAADQLLISYNFAAADA